MRPVTIIDYGVGNLLSVERALTHVGAKASVSSDPEVVARAERVVLPGVGAFSQGMQELRRRGFIDPILAFARSGRPLLGICLGMQMLLESSEEFGVHAGLGLIPGKVVAIPRTKQDGSPHKIPHIGWNALRPSHGADWARSVLAEVPPGAYAYFVHSFAAEPTRTEHRLADVDYNGRQVCATVGDGPIMGCQFHPEKSAQVGLSILQRFVNL
jgi:glutamine amidotransferase